MLRGLLKDKKAYDYINSKGKGKKQSCEYATDSVYYIERKEKDAGCIFSPNGNCLTGHMKRKNPMSRYKSPEECFSPPKKMFHSTLSNTARTVQPKRQKSSHNSAAFGMSGSNQNINPYGNYSIVPEKILQRKKSSDIFNVNKKPQMVRQKSGIKINIDRFKSFVFCDKPTEFKNTIFSKK